MLLNVKSSVPVLIVHWNRPAECLRTVQSFLNQAVPVSISVVDNASEITSFQTLQENLPANVELLRLEENKGWGGGLNVLLRRWLETPSEDYCFISAHDALPQANCLNMLLESMDNDLEIGIICPEYGVAEITQFSPILGPRLVPVTPRSHGTIETIPCPHGTLMLFRRECLEQIGVFDERYFAYGDEYELGLRARRYGWKVAVAWGAIVVNPGTWTPSRILSYLSARNSLLLASTYGGLGSAIVRSLLMLINTFKIFLNPSSAQRVVSSPSARLLAIRDFLLNRYGSPTIYSKYLQK